VSPFQGQFTAGSKLSSSLRCDAVKKVMFVVNSSSESKRILIVDDEPSILDAVATSLRYEGFDVDRATTGQAALDSAQERPPDLIVLDATPPDLDGLEVTRRLRALGVEAPVLFLAARDSTRGRIAGLSVGAHDYLTKPFALAEIVVRTRAILRRTGGEPQKDQPLRFADVEMDEDTREVRRAGVPIRLTAMEYNLLRYFLLNPRHVLSKMQIIDHVWRYDFRGNTNLVENRVSYLRKKLDPRRPQLIHTVRRVGYILRDASA
jgi:two-component system OmpR family response regulator